MLLNKLNLLLAMLYSKQNQYVQVYSNFIRNQNKLISAIESIQAHYIAKSGDAITHE